MNPLQGIITEPTLGEPLWLHSLWVAVVAAVLFALLAQWRYRTLRRAFDPALLSTVCPGASASRRFVKALLAVVALVALALALARPQSDPTARTVNRPTRDVVFLVDVSRSMLARDLAPNRLERAKLWIRDLLPELAGERVGLVAFAGGSSILSPLTTDRSFLRIAIDGLEPNAVARGGTLIGDALRRTLDEVMALDPDTPAPENGADIILITDGDDQESFPIEAARLAGSMNVRLIVLGLGSDEQGAPVPNSTGAGFTVYDDEIVRSRMNPQTLADMARATPGGVFLRVGTGTISLDAVYRDLTGSLASAGESRSTTTLRYREHFVWPLGFAILLLLVEGGIRERR